VEFYGSSGNKNLACQDVGLIWLGLCK